MVRFVSVRVPYQTQIDIDTLKKSHLHICVCMYAQAHPRSCLCSHACTTASIQTNE